MPQIPQPDDRFRRIRKLGSGGAGDVWLVEDPGRPEGPVALKQLTQVDASQVASLRSEFALVASLSHPSLADVYTLGTARDGHTPYFTMEFVDGDDLPATVAREGAAGLPDLLVECLRALGFLHDFGILHRDLKPANLLVRKAPRRGHRVVILDFGLALHGDDAGAASGPGGTLPYLAPELLQGCPASRRSDLYGLGMVAHEALYGALPVPFTGDDVGAYFEALQARRRERPDPNRSASEGLLQWVERLIDPDPDRRPAGAVDALGALQVACGRDWPLELPVTRRCRLASGEPPAREATIAAVREALEIDRDASQQTPEARVAWVVGEAGEGKSRLLRWLEVVAIRAGWQVIDQPGQLGHDGDAFDASMLDALRDRSSRAPHLLVIDELERRPPDTAALLERLLTEAQDVPLRVLVATRWGELGHPALKTLIANSDLLAHATRIDLPRLEDADVAAVLERAGIDARDDQRKTLLDRSEGNPLVLESLIVDGLDAPTDGADDPIARSVAVRIEGLSDSARRACMALGVLERGTTDAVARVGEIDADAKGAMAEVADAGLAVRERREWARGTRLITAYFRNASRQAYVATVRRAADWMEADDRKVDPARLARWWAEVGEVDRARKCAIEAAEDSRRRHQPSDAADWIAFALRHSPRRSPERAELRQRQAGLLYRAARFEEAARAYAALAQLVKDDDERVVQRGAQVECLARARRLNAARHVANSALGDRYAAGDRARAHVETALAMTLMLGTELDAAVETARRAIRVHEREGSQTLLVQSHMVETIALYQLRRMDEAIEAAHRGVALARTVGVPSVLADALIARNAVVSQVEPADVLARQIAVVRRYLTLSRQTRLLPPLLTAQIDSLRRAARFDAALQLTTTLEARSVQWAGRDGYLSMRTHYAENLAEAGRPMEAAALLQDLLSTGEGFSPRPVTLAKFTLAEVLLQQQDPPLERIGKLLREQMAATKGNYYFELGGLVNELDRRSRPGCDEPFDEAWTEYEAFDPVQARQIQPEFVIRIGLYRAAWLIREGRAAEAETMLPEIVSLAKKLGVIVLEARGRGLQAEALAATGRDDEARDALRQARDLVDEAAARIDDDALRADFRAHPNLASIRNQAWAKKDVEKDRLLAIYRMIHALNSETDPELLLESILDMALDVVQAERGLILLRDRAGEAFRVRLARNLEKETIADAAEFSRGVVRAAGAGKAVLSIDTRNDDRMREFKSVSMYGIRSVLCVPLRSRGKIAGAVYLDSRSDGALFSENELEFLEAFADHAALALENAQIRSGLERTNRRLQVAAEERVAFGGIIGRSAPMQRVFDLIAKVTQVQVPVLIQGQSGTGKELVARAIHHHGPRKRKPFLSENCAAIPETLLESELFGHVKGAFTGADRDRDGLFQQADTGTLFLDEVGDMPAPMQARLLRVLQEGEVRKVGGEGVRHVDVRIVAATNRDLAAEVEAGRFREDLLYRLQVLLIELPPLRERVGDVPLLVEFMLEKIGKSRGRPAPPVRSAVLDLLERHPWPGNVRQLENTLQRMVVLAGDGPITVELVERDRTLARSLLTAQQPSQAMYSLEENEKEQIRAALRRTEGNRAKAARLLGISRATIFRKIKDYRLA